MSYSTEVIADTPIAYYRLGEAAGATTTANTSGAAPAMAVGANVTAGVAGALVADANTAFSFAGGICSVTTSAFAVGTGDFSVEMICRSVQAGAAVGFGSSSGNAWWLGFNVGKATLAIGGGTNAGGTTVNDNNFHHVIATRTSGTVRIYVDGVLDNTPSTNATSMNSTVAAIGGFEVVSFTWTGVIDEVAFYGTALSAARVLAHYRAAVGVQIANAGWYWSAAVDRTTGTAAVQINPGPTGKTNFTGTSAKLVVDVSAMVAAGVSAKKYPRIRWSIDGGAYTTQQLLSTDTVVTLATGLSAGTHSLDLRLVETDAQSPRWNRTMSLVINSLALDFGASVSAPTLRPYRLIAFGDSITEGAWVNGPPTDLTDYSNFGDSEASWAEGFAQAYDCELSNCSFGGQSWDSTYNGDVPSLPNTADFYSSGRARVETAFDWCVINMGANGGVASSTTVKNFITARRTAYGAGCKIVVMVPFGGTGRGNITSGFGSYTATNPTDKNVFLIDLGSIPGVTAGGGVATFAGFDGLHPSVLTQGRLGAMTSKAALASIPVVANVVQINGTAITQPLAVNVTKWAGGDVFFESAPLVSLGYVNNTPIQLGPQGLIQVDVSNWAGVSVGLNANNLPEVGSTAVVRTVQVTNRNISVTSNSN